MVKLFLLSVLVVTVLVPTLAARSSSVAKGLRWTLGLTWAFAVVYWLGVQALLG